MPNFTYHLLLCFSIIADIDSENCYLLLDEALFALEHLLHTQRHEQLILTTCSSIINRYLTQSVEYI